MFYDPFSRRRDINNPICSLVGLFGRFWWTGRVGGNSILCVCEMFQMNVQLSLTYFFFHHLCIFQHSKAPWWPSGVTEDLQSHAARSQRGQPVREKIEPFKLAHCLPLFMPYTPGEAICPFSFFYCTLFPEGLKQYDQRTNNVSCRKRSISSYFEGAKGQKNKSTCFMRRVLAVFFFWTPSCYRQSTSQLWHLSSF